MMMLIVVCFLHAVAKDNENVNYLRLLRYARNDGFFSTHAVLAVTFYLKK